MSEDKFKIVRSPVIEDQELPETHEHNNLDQPAIDLADLPAGTDHATLTNVTIDQHHARDHATRHLAGGGDELSLTVLEGGTGIETYTQGDIIYSSAANTLAKLVKNANATRYLSNTGTDNNPAWAQVNLANGVTGTLPVANGGTGGSVASITLFNNITGFTAAGTTGTTSTNLVFSTSPTLVTPILGTPTSGTLTNCTGLPLTGLTSDTTTALGVGSINLGHATDTTIARVSAGVISIEGSEVVTENSATVAFQQATTISTTTGALGITPAAGSNLNVTLSTTGDFAVNTNQLYVDTSAGNVGIGTASPGAKLEVLSSDGGVSFMRDSQVIGDGGYLILGKRNSAGTYTTFAQFNAGATTITAGAEDGYFRLQLMKAGTVTEHMRITKDGYVGIGVTIPTAVLHLKAGTATASTAPLKFNSGTLLTTAEAGAVEFLTDKWYATITTDAARKEFTLNDAALTSGKIPIATTNGRLTDGQTPLTGTKVYYVADSSGGAVTRKLTFIDGILTAET